MERNLGAEMDALRGEMKEIRGYLADLATALGQKSARDGHGDAGAPPPAASAGNFAGHIWKQTKVHPDPHIQAIMDTLENQAGEQGSSGGLTYLGVYASGGRQSSWVRHMINTDDLVALLENRTAGRVLRSIGSDERLAILLAILRRPHSVAQLVEQCGFNTTGQVYHHLKALLAADLVREDESNRGVYVTQPHRVQGIIMVLAGIADLLDEKYTQGSFDPAEDEAT